jgi:two-component system sensor histidine kinase RegB
VEELGRWAALALVAVVIAYFMGRVMRSLRQEQQELAKVREQATRNEQLAALTTLAAGAAHELGTPLGTIAVVAKELELAASSSGGESMAEDARLIREEVDRCRRILDRMRVDIIEDLSQKPGKVNLNDLIERLRQDLDREEQGRLQVRYSDDIDVVVAPSRAVQQAVGVLLRNAFDATPAGERVTLGISKRDGNIVFEVADKGEGMPEEVLRRAGEPFFTTKAPGRGMGLGLFLVRLVAEKAGGRLKLHSKQGEGTVSVLELPEA